MKKDRDPGKHMLPDHDLWRQVTKSVKAYHPRKSPPEKPSSPQEKKTAQAPEFLPKPAPAQKESSGRSNPGFDRATETRFRKGRLPIEATLDLHGMTQNEAFSALSRFIRAAVSSHKRTLLVITGKGSRAQERSGVLRRLLPLWLEEESLKSHVLALSQARPKDGGGGAFYIRLRKKR